MLLKDFFREILFDELVLMLMFLGCLCVNKTGACYLCLNRAFSNL